MEPLLAQVMLLLNGQQRLLQTLKLHSEVTKMTGEIVLSAIVPVHPHPLLVPEKNEGWGLLRQAFTTLRQRIIDSGAETIIIYSTTWPNIIGHQLLADPNPKWTFVDADFHDLGSLPYDFQVDTNLTHAWHNANERRGLSSRTVNYHGFPVDVGSVVSVSLLNPDNRFKVAIVSSNIYANRSETLVLSKACLDAVKESGKKVAVICAMSLSNRMFTEFIEPNEDRIHSLKDDEWNRKILELLEKGRLEDIAQLSRQIHSQIRVQKVVSFKPMWFLSGVNGQTNNLKGEVLAYEALHGAGGAVVLLTPTENSAGDKEYDEDDAEVFSGDRSVLEGIEDRGVTTTTATSNEDDSNKDTAAINSQSAPKPVGAYPHARKVGDLLYLSGVGSRTPDTDEIPGGPCRDENGISLDYDIAAQTHMCIENVKRVLESAGSSLEKVQDITVFLIDMDRDFATFNQVYSEYFVDIKPTRTTLAINALPTPIAVELKVIASF
jgi:reactive intermediate/imine deaminase